MLAIPLEFQACKANPGISAHERVWAHIWYLREPYTHLKFASLYWTSEKCWIFTVTLLMRPRIALLCEWGEQMGANAKPSQFSSSSQAAQSLSKATTNGRLSRIALRRICCCLASICGLDQISLIYLWVWSDQSVCLRAIRSDLSDLPPFSMRLGSLSSAAVFWRQKKSTLPLRSLAISDSNWG